MTDNVIIDQIKARITSALHPTMIEIVDKTSLHAGHYRGISNEQGQQIPTHLHIIISVPHLKDMPKVELHRKIYAELDAELKQGLHAVTIDAT